MKKLVIDADWWKQMVRGWHHITILSFQIEECLPRLRLQTSFVHALLQDCDFKPAANFISIFASNSMINHTTRYQLSHYHHQLMPVFIHCWTWGLSSNFWTRLTTLLAAPNNFTLEHILTLFDLRLRCSAHVYPWVSFQSITHVIYRVIELIEHGDKRRKSRYAAPDTGTRCCPCQSLSIPTGDASHLGPRIRLG